MPHSRHNEKGFVCPPIFHISHDRSRRPHNQAPPELIMKWFYDQIWCTKCVNYLKTVFNRAENLQFLVELFSLRTRKNVRFVIYFHIFCCISPLTHSSSRTLIFFLLFSVFTLLPLHAQWALVCITVALNLWRNFSSSVIVSPRMEERFETRSMAIWRLVVCAG